MAAHLGIAIKTLEDGRKELSGRTFNYKDQIKAAGGRWDPDRKVWALSAEAKMDFLPPPPPPPPKPKPREQWTREEYQNWLARSRSKIRGPCCSEAVAFESRPYGPICYRCAKHGLTRNDYCGD
jgi:hypothetical protein